MFGLQKAIEDCTRNFNRMGFALEDIIAIAERPHLGDHLDMSVEFDEIARIARAACPERGPDYDRTTALV